MTLTEALLAAGYTHRPASIYARAILDESGECVAVLAAHEVTKWLAGRSA